jgi:hypothetical protein
MRVSTLFLWEGGAFWWGLKKTAKAISLDESFIEFINGGLIGWGVLFASKRFFGRFVRKMFEMFWIFVVQYIINKNQSRPRVAFC